GAVVNSTGQVVSGTGTALTNVVQSDGVSRLTTGTTALVNNTTAGV
ncbi:hypothetical protein QRD42_04215, partial [Enterobacter sp. PGRG2]